MEQKWPSEIVIVRHGESERNVAKDAAKLEGAHSYGAGLRDIDSLLTETGRQQAKATGENLAGAFRFDAAFSSPYTRARQTAELILAPMVTKPPLLVCEERIREIEFGVLDGLITEGLKARYPEELARREREGKYWYRPPGGESRPDVSLRVHSFLGTLTRDYRSKSVLVVCHSVVVLVFRRLLERWGEADYLRVDEEDDVKNCGVTFYKYDRDRNKLSLEFYNRIYYQNPLE